MLLHGRVGFQITVSVQQAVLVTACMQVVVLPPDSGIVGVAHNEVYVRSVLSTEFRIVSLEGLYLFAILRIFLFERVNLTLE